MKFQEFPILICTGIDGDQPVKVQTDNLFNGPQVLNSLIPGTFKVVDRH